MPSAIFLMVRFGWGKKSIPHNFLDTLAER